MDGYTPPGYTYYGYAYYTTRLLSACVVVDAMRRVQLSPRLVRVRATVRVRARVRVRVRVRGYGQGQGLGSVFQLSPRQLARPQRRVRHHVLPLLPRVTREHLVCSR